MTAVWGAGALCLAQPALLSAQSPPPPPADSASKPVLTPVSITGRRARASPPPVATIELDTLALRRIAAANPYDLVRRVAGIEVHEQGQGPGFTANAVLRGFNSDHSADVLLVVDGVPINAAVHGHVEGFADWNVLVPAATQSMRVIHGSASPLYGDFALAGVVEVFTAADAIGASGSLSTSSFGDVGGWVTTGARGSRGGYLLAADGQQTQGWQQNAEAAMGNLLLRGWRTVAGGRLEGGVQRYQSRWDSPGFVSVVRYNARDLRRPVDSTDGGTSGRMMAHLRYARSVGTIGGRALSMEATGWTQTALSDWYLSVPGEGVGARQVRERDDRQAFGGQLQLLLPIQLGNITAGASIRADGADYIRDATRERVSVSANHSYDARYLNSAAFARLQRLVGQRLALDLGVRWDALTYAVTDRVAGSAEREHTQQFVSPKLGARYYTGWSPREVSVSLLGSVSQGFRGPVGVIADPTRAPFRSWTNEVGVQLDHTSAHLHAALFRTTVDNERVFDVATLGVSSAGASVRQGVDLRAEWTLPVGAARSVQLFGSATINDARFRRSSTVDTGLVTAVPQNTIHDHNIPIVPGAPVPGVSRYTGRIGAAVPLWLVREHRGDSDSAAPSMSGAGDYMEARVTYRVLGPFTPVGEPGLTTRPASVLDVGVSIPLPELVSRRGNATRSLPNLVLDLELQNALNLRYVENRASGFITPGVPRLFRMGLRVGAS